MNYKLYLDTSDQKKIIVQLFLDGILLAEKINIRHFSSQILLSAIEAICLENKITPTDIKAIEVNRGPGSYTGLKIGAAVANAFAWFLKIPANGKYGKTVEPVFE